MIPYTKAEARALRWAQRLGAQPGQSHPVPITSSIVCKEGCPIEVEVIEKDGVHVARPFPAWSIIVEGPSAINKDTVPVSRYLRLLVAEVGRFVAGLDVLSLQQARNDDRLLLTLWETIHNDIEVSPRFPSAKVLWYPIAHGRQLNHLHSADLVDEFAMAFNHEFADLSAQMGTHSICIVGAVEGPRGHPVCVVADSRLPPASWDHNDAFKMHDSLQANYGRAGVTNCIYPVARLDKLAEALRQVADSQPPEDLRVVMLWCLNDLMPLTEGGKTQWTVVAFDPDSALRAKVVQY